MSRKRASWKRRSIILMVAVPLALCAVFTGGVAFTDRDWFGGQRNIVLAEGLKADAWLAPHKTTFGIPFVFHYDGNGPPFGLRIQIWDKSKQYAAIDITEVRVAYADGDVHRATEKWYRQLTPYTQRNSSSQGIILTEMMKLSDEISELVGRHADVTITIIGYLTKSNGERVDFSTPMDFKAKTYFRVSTFWADLMDV